ncbi:MAG TPA: hypothetical protein VK463_11295 [Desulfomonilaceae bacterium]|nr:hypothetical protein [Desulfomonilaceae bacterium]
MTSSKQSFIRIRFFTGNSILGTGWRHSFAADDAEPSHHFAQESPQPGNLINFVANAYQLLGAVPDICQYDEWNDEAISMLETGDYRDSQT